MKNGLLGLLAVACVVAVTMGILRGGALIKCVAAEYDLDRKTEFSFVTGNCMVYKKDGTKIYLNQVREMGGGE